MGAAALLRAVADADLRVMGQWRHGDRVFVRVVTRGRGLWTRQSWICPYSGSRSR
jgi:hypothetical protein